MPSKKRGSGAILTAAEAKRPRKGPGPSSINEYKGWSTPVRTSNSTNTCGAKLEHCKPAFLKPKRFWAAYIAQRRPVHIPSGEVPSLNPSSKRTFT